MTCKCEVEVLDGFSAIDGNCPNHEPQARLVVGTPVVERPKYPISYGLKIEVKKDWTDTTALPLPIALEALENAGFEIWWAEYDVLED